MRGSYACWWWSRSPSPPPTPSGQSMRNGNRETEREIGPWKPVLISSCKEILYETRSPSTHGRLYMYRELKLSGFFFPVKCRGDIEGWGEGKGVSSRKKNSKIHTRCELWLNSDEFFSDRILAHQNFLRSSLFLDWAPGPVSPPVYLFQWVHPFCLIPSLPIAKTTK